MFLRGGVFAMSPRFFRELGKAVADSPRIILRVPKKIRAPQKRGRHIGAARKLSKNI